MMFPTSVNSFSTLIHPSSDYVFLDRTLFMKEVLSERGSCFLILRPRRSGKTLFLSMLEEFLVRSDCATGIVRADFERTDIFRRLVHLRDKEEYSEEEQLELTCLERVWTLKGQYPVLSICFSGKHGVESIKSAIMVVAKKYDVLLSTSSRLNEAERKDFHRIATGKTKAWDQSILLLTYYISKHFGSQVVLLIDEYDSFLDLDFENGLGERVRSFVQGVLCAGLK
mmetsp:Transcript_24713/g.62548  ORF Transcript_24713/g.62548 Transcript_24713/m.62548 type:complete len:226 (-) Transcript_24713:3674-4351(-)